MKQMPDVDLLRKLPQIEEVLHHASLADLTGVPRDIIVDAVRGVVDEFRQKILGGGAPDVEIGVIAQLAAARAQNLTRPSLRRVINASGVIVHTNLGRSVMATEAIEAGHDVIAGYSTLEYDVEHMARGSRHDHCEPLICALTGAEAAIAVNNNAAAVMMVLSAGRDRRIVPHSRHHGAIGRSYGRGRHDEQDAFARLRTCSFR